MKLPDITLAGVQNEVAPALEQVGRAAQGLSSVVQQGIQAYGQEVVKNQTIDAHLDLAKGLSDVEQELRTRKAIPVAELRERLGPKFDALDDAVKNQPEVEVMDPATRQIVKKQADVPTWQVAEHLYDAQAEKAVEQAASRITVGEGWQAGFQRAAAGDIIARRSRIQGEQLQAMHDYQVENRDRQTSELMNAGDYRGARAIVQGASFLYGAKGTTERLEQVKVREIVDPAFRALTMVTQPAYREEGLKQIETALAGLAAPENEKGLNPETRYKYAHELSVAQKAAQDLMTKRDAARAAFGYAAGARDDTNPMRVSPEKAYGALDHDFEQGKFKGKEELYGETRRLLKEHITDRNDASKLALNNVAGEASKEFLSLDAQGRPRMSFSNIRPETLAKLQSFGKDGEDAIAALVKWDQANEMHARQRAQLPTAQESARAFAVERSMTLRPGDWRDMGLADQLAVLSGRKPVPGEPDAPGVAVSAKDFPSLSGAAAKISAAPTTVEVTSSERIALEEAEKAYPSLKNVKKAPGEAREALSDLKDRLGRFVNGEVYRTGKRPDDTAQRQFVNEQLRDVEVVKKFLGVPYLSTMKRLDAERQDGATVIPRPAPGAREPAPAKRQSAPAAGARVPSEQLGYAPGGVFEVQANGKWKRVQ